MEEEEALHEDGDLDLSNDLDSDPVMTNKAESPPPDTNKSKWVQLLSYLASGVCIPCYWIDLHFFNDETSSSMRLEKSYQST